jgi:hypothetical protein
MTELTPEQQKAIAAAFTNPRTPVFNLDLSKGDEDESGGGAIANARRIARKAMETCGDCIQAGFANFTNLFGSNHRS